MNQDKIVVVMGGPSTEAEISRQTGAAILKALQSKGYNAEGMELNPPTFAEDIKKSGCAIVFNALHGKFGEDGVLQGTLDMLGIPYTGSGVLAAAVTMDKAASKRVFVAEGISTPRSHTYHRYEMKRDLAAEIEQGFSLPVVVKAASQGSSIGVYIVETKEARVSAEQTKEIQAHAITPFTACGCKGVARVDMMLSEDGTPYVIEVNSVPGMTELSLVPDAGRAMGVEFPELCKRILEMAGFQK